jgi:hypothetical protein
MYECIRTLHMQSLTCASVCMYVCTRTRTLHMRSLTYESILPEQVPVDSLVCSMVCTDDGRILVGCSDGELSIINIMIHLVFCVFLSIWTHTHTHTHTLTHTLSLSLLHSLTHTHTLTRTYVAFQDACTSFTTARQ